MPDSKYTFSSKQLQAYFDKAFKLGAEEFRAKCELVGFAPVKGVAVTPRTSGDITLLSTPYFTLPPEKE